MKNAIIFSASSDIGYALCLKLIQLNYNVIGTYNTISQKTEELQSAGVILYKCNLMIDIELNDLLTQIKKDIGTWDSLYILQATMNPIGKLIDIDMNEWENSLKLNFINQIKIIQSLLNHRTKTSTPNIVTFAGGGTNNATTNYSAYTISKIALIKMMELLYAEYPDTKFSCIGPGWVNTKIHDETLKAKNLAGQAYELTLQHFNNATFTDMKDIIDCLIWIENSSKEEVSGRNFSVVHDDWRNQKLSDQLIADNDMYKLRRKGNEWKS